MSDKDAKGLGREELDALLARLDPDPERAARIYLELHRKLVRLFDWRSVQPSEELADEVLNRAARRFREGVLPTHEDPFPYLRGIAFLVYKEVVRREAVPPPWMPPPDEAPDPEAERRLEALERCLDSLPADQRKLVVDYHGDGDRIRIRQQIGAELGISLQTLRLRIHRLRKRLEDCLRTLLSHP